MIGITAIFSQNWPKKSTKKKVNVTFTEKHKNIASFSKILAIRLYRLILIEKTIWCTFNSAKKTFLNFY